MLKVVAVTVGLIVFLFPGLLASLDYFGLIDQWKSKLLAKNLGYDVDTVQVDGRWVTVLNGEQVDSRGFMKKRGALRSGNAYMEYHQGNDISA